jgi:hypothetical protein
VVSLAKLAAGRGGLGSLIFGVCVGAEYFAGDLEGDGQVDASQFDGNGLIEGTGVSGIVLSRNDIALTGCNGAFRLVGGGAAAGGNSRLDNHRGIADIGKSKIVCYWCALFDLPEIKGQLLELDYIFSLPGRRSLSRGSRCLGSLRRRILGEKTHG